MTSFCLFEVMGTRFSIIHEYSFVNKKKDIFGMEY